MGGVGGGNEGKDWKSEEGKVEEEEEGKTGGKVEGGGEGEEEALFIKGSRASINSPPEVTGSDDNSKSTHVLFQKSIAAISKQRKKNKNSHNLFLIK